ncbi:MAG: hypothetical protein ACJA2S_001779 [Cyclobacteriaceae bacterium]|jgi:uncharacterized protein (UPF0332 family)
MTEKDRKEYILYRIETARNTLDAAKVLAENGFWNSVVNRLYYAAFYAVNSLLVKNEIYTKSHSGVKGQFSLLFIKSGKLDKKYGRLFAELYDWRQRGDYENLVDYTKEMVEPLFIPVKEMIDRIEFEIMKDEK